MKENNQSFFHLIYDAKSLYLDHPKEIQDLIYWAVKLDDEARSALIFAYNCLNIKDEQ